VVAGGFGSAVLEFLHTRGRSLPRVRCLGIPARFVEHSPQAVLRRKYHLDPQGIVEEVRTALNHGTLHYGKGAAR
jgi:1-deoxy-D-xylulose-5-phosphate synthase